MAICSGSMPQGASAERWCVLYEAKDAPPPAAADGTSCCASFVACTRLAATPAGCGCPGGPALRYSPPVSPGARGALDTVGCPGKETGCGCRAGPALKSALSTAPGARWLPAAAPQPMGNTACSRGCTAGCALAAAVGAWLCAGAHQV